MPRSKSTSAHRRSRISRNRHPVNNKKPDRRAGERRNDGLPVALLDMLGGRLRFRPRPKERPTVSASRIAAPSRSSSSVVRNLSRPVSGNLSIPRAGLMWPAGSKTALFGEGKHRATTSRGSRFAATGWRFPTFICSLATVALPTLAGLHSAYVWKDMAMQIVPIEGGRGRLALRPDLVEVAVGKVATVTASRASTRAAAGSSPPATWPRIALRLVARLVWRQRAVLADGVKPLRPAAAGSLGAVADEETSSRRCGRREGRSRAGRYPNRASVAALRDRPFPW